MPAEAYRTDVGSLVSSRFNVRDFITSYDIFTIEHLNRRSENLEVLVRCYLSFIKLL